MLSLTVVNSSPPRPMLSSVGLVTTAAVVLSCGERRVWGGIRVLQATAGGCWLCDGCREKQREVSLVRLYPHPASVAHAVYLAAIAFGGQRDFVTFCVFQGGVLSCYVAHLLGYHRSRTCACYKKMP